MSVYVCVCVCIIKSTCDRILEFCRFLQMIYCMILSRRSQRETVNHLATIEAIYYFFTELDRCTATERYGFINFIYFLVEFSLSLSIYLSLSSL